MVQPVRRRNLYFVPGVLVEIEAPNVENGKDSHRAVQGES
jgi:hypothetical protein